LKRAIELLESSPPLPALIVPGIEYRPRRVGSHIVEIRPMAPSEAATHLKRPRNFLIDMITRWRDDPDTAPEQGQKVLLGVN
jgi:hypothetical protein